MPAFRSLTGKQIDALLRYLEDGAAGKDAIRNDKVEMAATQVPGEYQENGTNLKGAAVYLQNCATCHGDHRQGMPPTFPALLGVGHRMTSQ